MPVTAAIRQRCRELLPAGETIHYVFPVSLVGSGGVANFMILVSDRFITVLATKVFSRYEPAAVWATHPRDTRLGPIEFAAGPRIRLGGTVFEVDEEYVAVVGAADTEAFSPGDLPRDPLPDL
jgi:hypothetical protein